MTNDYAALVAMLDQAAADLQAEIDAAIDRHAAICRPPRWTGGPDAQRTPSPPVACTWPGCTFVSSPSGTGSHMAAHRRAAQGVA